MARKPQKSFRYTGPVTPLPPGSGGERMLFPGARYSDLPEDDPVVSNLIARKLLVAEDGSASSDPVSPATSEGA